MAITVTAGQRITASMLNGFAPTYLKQAANQALATTTFTNHNTFANIAFDPNQTWEVVVRLASTSADAGNDYRVTWVTTGTVTEDSYRYLQSPGLTGTGSADTTANNQARTFAATVSTGSTTSATVLASHTEAFTLTTGASGGTLTLQWAQNAAVTGTTTILAGSHMILRRLS